MILVSGQIISLQDAEKYWVIVGLAINKTVVPQLQPFVDNVLKDLYQHLNNQHQLSSQTKPNFLKSHSGHDLVYKSINQNDQRTKSQYKYEVRNHIDLGKLFVQPHMALFSAFTESDASTVLSLITKVDDTCCQSKFKKQGCGALVMIDNKSLSES